MSYSIPKNEPVYPYAPGDERRASLKAMLKKMGSEKIEIPVLIGGKEIRTDKIKNVVKPHAKNQVIAECHQAGPEELNQAVKAALFAKKDWQAMPWQVRAKIFMKAADLLAGPYRDVINASTMLGQSKNVYQAEIDSACEMIDFFRFNVYFYQEILKGQPISSEGVKNSMDYRPLDGFVSAISPFNFTSIAGNLSAAPALLGNTVVWKPSETQVHSAYYLMKLFEEAGVPPGVINLVPCQGRVLSEVLFSSSDFSGLHFTGSTKTFNTIWKTVGQNVDKYKSYPRLVGETGGKNFVFVHPSADVDVTVTALIRGAFEYQGQKCSAASRAYLPKSLSEEITQKMVAELKTIKMGDVCDFTNLVNAVIDQNSFDSISAYIDEAKKSSDCKILSGGGHSDKDGFFIEPTVILTTNPKYKTMCEEIFGPVLTVYVYDDSKIEEAIAICENGSPYGLTGAVIAEDRQAVTELLEKLRFAAGNFYINDKPTGAVVGQQPFGGARASGTNDKAGSSLNLYRWLSPRVIKENLSPPKNYRYSFLNEE